MQALTHHQILALVAQFSRAGLQAPEDGPFTLRHVRTAPDGLAPSAAKGRAPEVLASRRLGRVLGLR